RHDDRKLVEDLALRESELPAGQRREPIGHGVRALEAGLCYLAHAGLTHVGHVDRRGQRTQRVIRADVGGGLLPADVLLARREREHETAPALTVLLVGWSPRFTFMPRPSLNVCSTSTYSGCRWPATRISSRPVWTRAIIEASATEVAPSYSDAFATSIAVSSAMSVWNS